MKSLDNLTQEQNQAATSLNSSILISAGAGTGKTKVLTARIANLISNEDFLAPSVMAVTFTKKSANEIEERVISQVGSPANGLRIGTFHSLSNRILRKYASYCGLTDGNYTIIDDTEQKDIVRIAAMEAGAYGEFIADEGMTEAQEKKAHKVWSEGLKGFIDQAVRQISLWKSWGLTADMAADVEREDRDELTEKLAVTYSAYQFELERRDMCDFGDLILKVVILFDNHPDICRSEAIRVKHMLIDEAQDANQVQIRWVKHLTSVHNNITVVGDEDQNIYGFQGGYAGAMSDMAGPNSTRYSLTKNWRCTSEILTPANQIVDYNTRDTPKVLVSDRSGDPVRVTSHPTDISEAAWMSSRIKELVEQGVDPSEIAVLFRSSFLIQPFEEALARKGVPSYVSSGSSLMAKEEIRDVIAMVRLAVNPRDDLAFVRIANKPARSIGTSACAGIISIAHANDMELHEACLMACEDGYGIALNKTAKAGAKRLSRALSMLSEDGRWGRPTFDMITTGLFELKYDKHLDKLGDKEDRLLNVETIKNLSEPYREATTFLQDMALITDGDPTTYDMKKVKLLTMHASKGLEFEHVFCPGFNNGVIPTPRALEDGAQGTVGDIWHGPSGGGLEEERRLAHVALTRAKKTLDIGFPWRRKRNSRKTVKTQGPSFFIEECDLRYEDMESVSTAELGKIKSSNELEGRHGFDR